MCGKQTHSKKVPTESYLGKVKNERRKPETDEFNIKVSNFSIKSFSYNKIIVIQLVGDNVSYG